MPVLFSLGWIPTNSATPKLMRCVKIERALCCCPFHTTVVHTVCSAVVSVGLLIPCACAPSHHLLFRCNSYMGFFIFEDGPARVSPVHMRCDATLRQRQSPRRRSKFSIFFLFLLSFCCVESVLLPDVSFSSSFFFLQVGCLRKGLIPGDIPGDIRIIPTYLCRLHVWWRSCLLLGLYCHVLVSMWYPSNLHVLNLHF